MTVISIHVGMPRTEDRKAGSFVTGGVKTSVESAVLRFPGFEGDGVADRKHHGGADRTACVYPAGHYAWWKATYGYELLPGAFSENLTVDGVQEDAICIGDIIQVGEARTQVTLPRDPCLTIDRINEIPSLHQLVRDCGRCGFHMRTLKEGVIKVGDAFRIVERNGKGVTVAMALDLYHGRSKDRAIVRLLQDMPEFAEEGKRELVRRIG